MDEDYNSFLDTSKSYILLDNDNHFEIQDMVSRFNNSLAYKTTINGFTVNISYQNVQSEINSDTISTLFKLGLIQKYHSYNINISKRYNKWTGGLGYSINTPLEVYNNYNFYIKREIGQYFNLEYRYAYNTLPTRLSLDYEDFKYSTVNNQDSKTSSILYSFRNSRVENNFKHDRISYSNLNNSDFDLIQKGKKSTKIDLLVNLNKKIDIYIDWESSLDSMTSDLLKNESIFYKINMFKTKGNSYLLKINYKLQSGAFTLGLNQKNYQYELSSRINIQDISDNLVDMFTVPIINGLDTIKIIQDNIFLFYNKKMNNSKYKIGINYSKNSIYYYHRAGTPPLNPLIPIFKVQKGDYTLNMINLIFHYSFIISKLNIDIIVDNMSPLSVINEIDDSKGSIIDDIPPENRLLNFNQLHLLFAYPIK